MAKPPTETPAPPLDANKPMCGLVMPIAALGDYEQGHWTAVESILSEAIKDAGFDAKLVSQETASGVIHQRIITNLYTNPLVVCDVSGRNPNVMFELGMRLAFDKPTIIVKDDDTPFSFDTNPIEHVPYPRSLKYAEIIEFKERLSLKVRATAEAAKADPNYSTFLRHIGGFVPAKMELKEIPAQEFLAKQLDQIMLRLDRMDRRYRTDARYENEVRSPLSNLRHFTAKFHGIRGNDLTKVRDEIFSFPGVFSVNQDEHPSGEITFSIAVSPSSAPSMMNEVGLTLSRRGAQSIEVSSAKLG